MPDYRSLTCFLLFTLFGSDHPKVHTHVHLCVTNPAHVPRFQCNAVNFRTIPAQEVRFQVRDKFRKKKSGKILRGKCARIQIKEAKTIIYMT